MSTYPKPMFSFDERGQVCINKMKYAYEVGMYGDDERLKDRSWKDDFAVSGERPRKRQKRDEDM